MYIMCKMKNEVKKNIKLFIYTQKKTDEWVFHDKKVIWE